jgi:hypothetical protein
MKQVKKRLKKSKGFFGDKTVEEIRKLFNDKLPLGL